jgi:abortive infection bacteriophage resistance protein
MSLYTKPFLTLEQQLSVLKARGLSVSDDVAALACLSRFGYYRLSAYWYPLRETTVVAHVASGRMVVQRLDHFKADTNLQQVIHLYVFDKRLRLLVLDAIERIEVALRVDIAFTLGSRDPFAHTNMKLLHGSFVKQVNPSTGRTRYQDWMAKHTLAVARSRDDFVKHFDSKYGSRLPIWVSVELWDFGMLSTFFKGMKVVDQSAIAARYGIPDWQLLQSWLRSLNFVRNVAAHHSRLWNKNLIDQPKLPKAGAMPDFDAVIGVPDVTTRLFVVLCITLHLLRAVCPNSSWPKRLRQELMAFPTIQGLSVADMGFPAGWETQPLWKP